MKEKKNSRSCFDWIQLFVSISIPVAIAVYTVLDSNRELAIATANRAHDLNMADNEQKDIILNECQKVLSKLIEQYGTQFEVGSSASLVARFAVLSALNRLDVTRRNFLIRLLYEAKLITGTAMDCKPSVNLQSANLMDLSFSSEYQRQELYNLSLQDTVMSRADFSYMNIYGGNFRRSMLNNANFAWTRNSHSFDNCANTFCMENGSSPLSFDKANLTMASFHAATYDRVHFIDALMANASLDLFFCEHCEFRSINMNGVSFRGGAIQQSSIMFSSLDNANLYKSNFGPNVEFFGSSMTNTIADYTRFTECQFMSFDFKNTLFNNVSFTNATFTDTKMDSVSMEYGKLFNTTFNSVNLSDSNLRHVYCERCIFNRVDFTNADLSYATFIKSDLTNATITEKQLKQMKSLEHSILPNNIVSNSK